MTRYQSCHTANRPLRKGHDYKKLNAEQKVGFQVNVCVCRYLLLDENRLIPFGEDMADIRKWMLEAFAEEYGILMKEDSELKNYLMTLVISTLNKLLKAEKKIQEKENP